MEMRLYFQMLRRGRWMIALTTIVALITSLLASYLTVPQFRATASFIITPSTALTSGSEMLQSLSTLDRASIMSTYAEVMKSSRVFNDTLAFMQLSPDNLKDYSYETEILSGSTILELSVSGPNPHTAAQVANTIGYQAINFTQNMNRVFDVEFLDVAVPPAQPFKPQPVRNIALALVFGLVGGSFLAILNEQLRIPLESLRQRLKMDNVTGTYTNSQFSRIVADELIKKPEVLSIGIIELRGIRDIFDTYPLAGLQKILLGVTEVLRGELRGNDVIGRWDEISFIVLLPNTTGQAASRIFERIYQVLSKPLPLELLDAPIDLDVHIGGAEYSTDISSQELFDKANTALEAAQKDKNQRVYVWELKNPFWERQISVKSGRRSKHE